MFSDRIEHVFIIFDADVIQEFFFSLLPNRNQHFITIVTNVSGKLCYLSHLLKIRLKEILLFTLLGYFHREFLAYFSEHMCAHALNTV